MSTVNRWLRGIGALLLVLAIAVGGPVLLLGWGTFPRISWWWLQGRDDGTLVLALLTVVGWLAWAWFTASVVMEFVVQVSGRDWRIPAFSWSRAAVAGLVLAVIGLATPMAHADEPASFPMTATPRTAEPVPSDGGGQGGHTPSAPRKDERPKKDERVLDDLVVRHTVRAGDDLWSLAEHYYGDGLGWRRIAQANPRLLTGGPDELRVGWRLLIPGVEATSEGATITVRPGDTLSGLARRHLGDADRWPELLRANRAILADPDELAVGMVLALPSATGSRRGSDEQTDTKTREQTRDETRKQTREQTGGRDDDRRTRPDQKSMPRDEQNAPGTTTEPAPPTGHDTQTTQGVSPVDLVLPALGALLAAGLTAAVAARRRVQLAVREPGRRIRPPDAVIERVENALGQRQDENTLRRLDLAQRHIRAHCAEAGASVPRLRDATASAAGLGFRFVGPPGVACPDGFEERGDAWHLPPETVLPPAAGAAAWPALVCVGRRDREHVLVDLAGGGNLVLDIASAEICEGARAALLMELTCAWWAEDAEITLIGRADPFVQVATPGRLGYIADVDRGLRHLQRLVASEDPGTQVVIIDAELTAEQSRRLQDLDLPDRQVGVVQVRSREIPGDTTWTITERPWPVGPVATLTGRLGVAEFSPQLVDHELRDALLALFEATTEPATEAAPWWSEGAEPRRAIGITPAQTPPPPTPPTPPTTPRSRRSPRSPVSAGVRTPGPVSSPHPQIQLLGPVRLVGCRGPAPTRAERQCEEYCAWLLAHPGLPGRAMADALLVAEGTRRSNVSRLRSWLGEDDDGRAYLPDAYAGGLRLHPAVTSDWQRFTELTAAGVDAAGDSALVAALELVRGAPLADAAPGQWHWAEGMRVDIISAVRDAALVLGRRALRAGDIAQVRWASARGLAAAPGDELLLACRLEAEHRAGNTREVRRLARRMADRARELDVPLSSQSVTLLQEVLEGRRRASSLPESLIS